MASKTLAVILRRGAVLQDAPWGRRPVILFLTIAHGYVADALIPRHAGRIPMQTFGPAGRARAVSEARKVRKVPNSGIAASVKPWLISEAARSRNVLALEWRERFAKRHPEIGIRAERVRERMVFYVKGPRDQICWFDAFAMMDDLEARYPDD
jgi:hypothetical protein